MTGTCPECETSIDRDDAALLGGCPECGASAAQMFDALDVEVPDVQPPSTQLREGRE